MGLRKKRESKLKQLLVCVCLFDLAYMVVDGIEQRVIFMQNALAKKNLMIHYIKYVFVFVI